MAPLQVHREPETWGWILGANTSTEYHSVEITDSTFYEEVNGILRDFEGVAARTFRVKYLIAFYIFDIEVKLCNGAMRSGCLQRGTAKDCAKEIGALGKGTQWREAVRKLAIMEIQDLRPDIITQNTILTAAMRLQHWTWALEWQKLLQAKGYQGDEVTCGLLVKAQGEATWQAAQASLGHAESRATVVSYGSALSAMEQRGVWQEVGNFCLDLQLRGLQPNVVIYNTWITSRREHEWRIAVTLYQQLHEMFLQPTVVTLAAMISGMAAMWQLAIHFLQEIGHQKLQVNLVALNSAITSCEKASQWTWALHLHQEASSETLQPNIISYSATMSACEKAAEWGPAL
eukprot:symbB.v1.2.028615.t1/scaffold3044.1/size64775/2